VGISEAFDGLNTNLLYVRILKYLYLLLVHLVPYWLPCDTRKHTAKNTIMNLTFRRLVGDLTVQEYIDVQNTRGDRLGMICTEIELGKDLYLFLVHLVPYQLPYDTQKHETKNTIMNETFVLNCKLCITRGRLV
jgi:hypothetical protein